MVAVGVLNATPVVAHADSAPANPSDSRTPPTVSSDVLPTTQIDGVAWNQLVVGNTVYVAGSFAKARPAGAAPGISTVTRQNLLAYDLTTGALKTGFVANLNAQAFALAKSPDGSRIYVGGDFTTVNGTAHSRIVALDPTTGTPKADFNPSANGSVRAIAATASTVYLGGIFSTLNGSGRSALGRSEYERRSEPDLEAGRQQGPGECHGDLAGQHQDRHRRVIHDTQPVQQSRLRPRRGQYDEWRKPRVPDQQCGPRRRNPEPRSCPWRPTRPASTAPATSSAPAVSSRERSRRNGPTEDQLAGGLPRRLLQCLPGAAGGVRRQPLALVREHPR